MARFIKRIFPFFYIGFIFHEKQKILNIFAICLTNFGEDTTSVLSAINVQIIKKWILMALEMMIGCRNVFLTLN